MSSPNHKTEISLSFLEVNQDYSRALGAPHLLENLHQIPAFVCVCFASFSRAESREFLLKILSHVYQKPMLAHDIIDGENKRPTLAPHVEPHVHFNLSHTDGCTVVIVSKLHRVGIDIEQIREVKMLPLLVTRYFTVAESQWICETKNTNLQHARFFELWTQKEALIKAKSSSILKGLKTVLETPIKREMHTQILTHQKNQYALTYCYLTE